MSAKLAALAAYLIGIGGASLFFAYVLGIGTGFWPRGATVGGPLAIGINVALLLLFALQHSGMARAAFKIRFEPLGRSLYVAASGMVLGLLTLCWQPIAGEPIWHGPMAIVALSLLAALGVGCCSLWFDHATFLGLTQAWTGNAEVNGPLRIEGPYRYVRHPLMLGILIARWAQPIMPPELLLLDGGMTAYILIAIRWEEPRRIWCLSAFGTAYEQYRREVPALIPRFRYRARCASIIASRTEGAAT